MQSVAEAQVDLAQLAERTRAVAEALKRLPSERVIAPEQWTVLANELLAVAAELRGERVAR